MGLIWQVIYYQRVKEYQLEEAVIPGERSLLNGSSSSAALPSYNSTSPTISADKNYTKKTRVFNWISAIAIVLVTVISCYTYYTIHWNGGEDDDSSDNARERNRMNWLPQTMGWASAILYVGSRIPQIIKNWKNKSTEGLSFGMFLCAVMGNVLFTSVSYNSTT